MTNWVARGPLGVDERIAASGSMPGAIVSEVRYRRILLIAGVGALVGLGLAVAPGEPLAGLTSTPAALHGAMLLAGTVTAILLQLRVRVLRDAASAWLADAFTLTVPVLWLAMQATASADVAAAATGLSATGTRSVLGIGPTEFVTLTLLWHVALVLAILGQLHLAERRAWRLSLTLGYAATIVLCVALPLDIAWFDADGFAPLHAVAVGGLLVAHGSATALWILRSGRRPLMSHAAITVALLLAAAELASQLVNHLSGAGFSAWTLMLTLAIFFAPAVTEGVSFAKLGHRAHRAEVLLAELARGTVDASDLPGVDDPVVVAANGPPRSLVRALIDRRQYRVALQPIVDLQSGRPIGYEALTRFRGHPNPSPDVVIGRAHAIGRGVDLELALLRAALARLDEIDEPAYLSVNVGSATLIDPGLAHVLAGDLRRVVLEVTEHVAIEDYAHVNAVLAPLRERGLRVAIDDAGAGFASLRHVVQLRPDVLKLDRSLVARADREPSQRAVLAAMIDIAHAGGMTVVGEGVERAEEAACLRTLGAGSAQGYLFGRPTIAVSGLELDLSLTEPAPAATVLPGHA